MREIRPSGSEGGVAQTNAPSLPLSLNSARRRAVARRFSPRRWADNHLEHGAIPAFVIAQCSG
jgi:hypothetical protein